MKLITGAGSSPGCLSRAEKSTVRPSSRGGVPVYCESLRLPEALVGQTVTIEGTLVSVVADEPLVNARGEVSQGEEPGSVRYVLRACVLR